MPLPWLKRAGLPLAVASLGIGIALNLQKGQPLGEAVGRAGFESGFGLGLAAFGVVACTLVTVGVGLQPCAFVASLPERRLPSRPSAMTLASAWSTPPTVTAAPPRTPLTGREL